MLPVAAQLHKPISSRRRFAFRESQLAEGKTLPLTRLAAFREHLGPSCCFHRSKRLELKIHS
jgi:hypothetical protein